MVLVLPIILVISSLIANYRVVNADDILVLVDSFTVRETHSIFLQSLRGRGHKLTVKTADDQMLSLTKYGERLYDHLVILAPGVDEFGGSVSVAAITSFIDDGGNVLVTAGRTVGDALRDLAAECGFEFDEDRTAVIDHLHYDSVLDEGDHTTIVVQPSQIMSAPMIVGNADSYKPILFRGTALVADKSNNLRLELVTAATSAYSFNVHNKIDEYPAAVGKSTLLVGALQARNNARVLLVGSMEMFSDSFIGAEVNEAGQTSKPTKSGNLQLITELSKWVLKEKGVLRVKSVSHHKVGEKHPLREYTITDNVEYSIEIEELKDGRWVPFDGNDVQLEFVRIDPFIRTTLQNSNGKLSARFMLPDVYGVFKFLVDYRRIGYTHLLDVQQVSVRPLQHTQYERFIHSAFPYYTSAFSMMIGVTLFSCIFLYQKEGPKDAKKTQ